MYYQSLTATSSTYSDANNAILPHMVSEFVHIRRHLLAAVVYSMAQFARMIAKCFSKAPPRKATCAVCARFQIVSTGRSTHLGIAPLMPRHVYFIQGSPLLCNGCIRANDVCFDFNMPKRPGGGIAHKATSVRICAFEHHRGVMLAVCLNISVIYTTGLVFKLKHNMLIAPVVGTTGFATCFRLRFGFRTKIESWGCISNEIPAYW